MNAGTSCFQNLATRRALARRVPNSTLTRIECRVQVEGDTPLHTACRAGDLHQVLQLISAGADIKIINNVRVYISSIYTLCHAYSFLQEPEHACNTRAHVSILSHHM
jgi:ankyrin repeat protein